MNVRAHTIAPRALKLLFPLIINELRAFSGENSHNKNSYCVSSKWLILKQLGAQKCVLTQYFAR